MGPSPRVNRRRGSSSPTWSWTARRRDALLGNTRSWHGEASGAERTVLGAAVRAFEWSAGRDPSYRARLPGRGDSWARPRVPLAQGVKLPYAPRRGGQNRAEVGEPRVQWDLRVEDAGRPADGDLDGGRRGLGSRAGARQRRHVGASLASTWGRPRSSDRSGRAASLLSRWSQVSSAPNARCLSRPSSSAVNRLSGSVVFPLLRRAIVA